MTQGHGIGRAPENGFIGRSIHNFIRLCFSVFICVHLWIHSTPCCLLLRGENQERVAGGACSEDDSRSPRKVPCPLRRWGRQRPWIRSLAGT